MAKLTHAELEFDGRQAIYEAEFVTTDFESPVLLIGVADFDEAQAILDTLERSAARKRKESPAVTAAVPATSSSGTVTRGQEVVKGPRWGSVDGEEWHRWLPSGLGGAAAVCGAVTEDAVKFAEPVEGETPVCFRCAKSEPVRVPPKPRDPPKCIRPGCIFDVESGDTCRDDANVIEEQKAEWRKLREVTPAPVAKRRAKEIREQVEGGASPEAKGAA